MENGKWIVYCLSRCVCGFRVKKYCLFGCECVKFDSCVVKEEINFMGIFWYVVEKMCRGIY